jgi:hypothetical protein
MMALLAEPDEPIAADGPDPEALFVARAQLAGALAEPRPKAAAGARISLPTKHLVTRVM